MEGVVDLAFVEAGRWYVVDYKTDRTIEDAGHNDLYHDPAFGEAMHEALARIEAAAAGKGAGATGGRRQP